MSSSATTDPGKSPTEAWPHELRLRDLRAAAALCIAHGNRINDINIERFEATYGTPGALTAIWEQELTKASLKPCGEVCDK